MQTFLTSTAANLSAKIRTILATAFLTLTLVGCATPTADELARADYGAYPTEYENVVKSYLNYALKDPESAKIEFLKKPFQGWSNLSGRKYGYIVCARVNAKNSYGGYVGARLSYFLIRDGAVIQALISDDNPITQGMIETGCGYR